MVRNLMLGAAAAALAVQPVLLAAQDSAAPAPAQAPALFAPQDDLERGLWMQMAEYERDLKTSQQVIHDEALNAYVRGILCRTVGEEDCRSVRLYVMRTPYFNASMAPNGVMQVWSGLLLRAQNEAQLAAVLGHEFAHFRDRHGVALFREAKSKSDAAAWLALTGVGLIFSFGMVGSLSSFSREQERDADLDGLAMLAAAGYDTGEAAVLWEQLLDEQDATRIGRGKKPKKRSEKAGFFDSHPASPERIAYLRGEAGRTPGVAGADGQAEFQAAMRDWWPVFLDDQLKMNDDGAAGYLLDSMSKAHGPSPWLSYGRAELHRRKGAEADLVAAVDLYGQAIGMGGDLPELWRGRGLALKKLGRGAEAKADLQEYLVRAPDAADVTMIAMIAGGME